MKPFFYRTKISTFTPVKTENFTLKLAENYLELWKVYMLRYEVFGKEYKQKKFPIWFDRDKFDKYADHLIIIDNKTEKIVGTYRLISGGEYFSAQSFDISSILALPGKKLELGRACVHKDFRNTGVLNLLFTGIIQYTKLFEADYLFGCSSIKTTDPAEVTAIYNFFKKDGVVVESDVCPKPGYQFIAGRETNISVKEIIPPLLRLYLKIGARVYGTPGMDYEMNCSDFFTVLKFSEVDTRLLHRFEKK